MEFLRRLWSLITPRRTPYVPTSPVVAAEYPDDSAGADTVPFLPAIQTGYDHHTLAESVQRQAIRDVCDVIAANPPPAPVPQKAVQDAQRRGGICNQPGGCKHPPRAYEGQP